MDNQTDGKAQEINFSKGRSAKFVTTPGSGDPAKIIGQLGLPQPRTVILIIGGADELSDNLKTGLDQLFSRGIARAAIDTHAAIIDGGTRSGVMSLIGEGVADRGKQSPLIGIAPAPKVTYPGGPAEGSIEGGAALEPNHDFFVLVNEPEWGDEVEVMFDLAEALSPTGRVVAVVVNGGDLAKEEALRCVRHSWPLIVIAGSGRIADEIVSAKSNTQTPNDPSMAEIVAEGDIHVFSAQGAPAELRRLIVQQLSSNGALRLAWEKFAIYDINAQRQQNSFSGILTWILWLGVMATALAVFHKEMVRLFPDGLPPETAFKVLRFLPLLMGIPPLAVKLLLSKIPYWFTLAFIYYAILVIPITTSILVAASNRFKTGKKWVLLRGSAEAIKRDIFLYRTRTGSFSDEEIAKAGTTREVLLSKVVANIARRISQTEVNELALKPYDGSLPPPYGAAETDDGMSMLSPEAYIAGRLDDQLKYFERSARKIQWRIRWRQWAIYIVGGLGTLLAAINQQIWIAVTTAVATTLAAHVEHFQLESTLVKYNQSASDLSSVKGWWRALAKEAQQKPENISLLVESTEKILESELTGWVQRMQDAMEKVTAAEGALETASEEQPEQPATPMQRTCLVFMSPASKLNSEYETLHRVLESYQLVCERIDPRELGEEDADREAKIATASLILIDLSTNEVNNYFLTGLLSAKEKKWIGLAESGQSPNIRTSGEQAIIEISVDEKAATPAKLAAALEKLEVGAAT